MTRETTATLLRPPRGPTIPAPGRAHRVWLVDDDEGVRPLLARLLSRVKGIECSREFSSPDALLAALQQEAAPDTIPLDVHLGAQNGVDFIRPIKARAPATRVVMISTFYDMEQASRALRTGASGYLVKVASLAEIVAHILPEPAHPQPRPAPTVGFRGQPGLRHTLTLS